MAYLWTKLFHVLFVMAWMATVFYLPRILVNLAEAGAETAVRDVNWNGASFKIERADFTCIPEDDSADAVSLFTEINDIIRGE